MPDSAPRSAPQQPPTPVSPARVAGTLLCRVIVPLWVLAGAAFKLYERNPGNLPSVIRDISRKQLGWENLDGLLRTLIGLELFAVAVMILLPRFSRAMAIFMLSCFCLILVGEIATGAATCGCFGSLPIKPYHMLIIDGALLLAVLALPTLGSRSAVFSARGSLAAAAVMLVVGLGVAFAVPNPPPREQTAIANAEQTNTSPSDTTTTQSNESTTQTDSTDAATRPEAVSETPSASQSTTSQVTQPVVSNAASPTVNPTPKPLPASWYTQKMDEWIGKPWRELEIFQMMPTWPRDMDSGPRYIIFYSRTCDHCLTMLEVELVDPLDGLTTLVEVPASRTVMTDPNAWDMPMTVELILGAEMLQLPLGPNWVITTPLVIKTMDGKVVCATEGGDHKKCLGIP